MYLQSTDNSRKKLSTGSRGLAALAVGVLAIANAVAQPVGQWDFDDVANRLKATVGGDLVYADGVAGATSLGTSFGTASSFGIPNIGGQDVVVMKFPAATNAAMGINMPVNAAASGGGSLVNEYTLIMDILFPLASDGKVRGLVEADGRVLNADAEFKVNGANAIGGASFAGNLSANQWHRVGFVMTGANIRKYIDGVEVGTEAATIDSRFALSPAGVATLFTDDNGESQAGYVSSIQLRNTALTLGQMLALGGAVSTGIPQALPPVPAFIETRVPGAGAVNVAATTQIHVVLNIGDSTVPEASVQLLLDGIATGALPSDIGTGYDLVFDIDVAAEPGSVHTLTVNYTENGTAKSVSWKYTVVNYQKITLPTPIYFENFDGLAEAVLPDGWSVTNRTTVDARGAGLGLESLYSDAYLNWVVVHNSRLPANRKQFPLISLNGEFLTEMTTENLIYAESDVRSGEQAQTLFTKDYDLTGRTNVFVVFKSLYAQNQDNVNALEYSVDEGLTYNPLLIMVNGRADNSDVIRLANGTIDAVATLNTARTDQAWDLSYGAYLSTPITQALAPFISPRIDDDQNESKRIEVIRVPLADNKPKVRFRFVQAGTASWYWGVDDFGLYSINTPVVTAAPANQTVDAGQQAQFAVTASGGGTLTYQWQKDGNNITGATGATYSIAAATPNDEGSYRVIVSNADGPTTSPAATLTVISKPQITTQPVGATVSASAAVTLNVAARGGQPLTYQWQKDGVNITGATSASYQIAAATTANAGLYRVVVSNSYGNTESSVVQLSVYSGAITNDLVGHFKFDGNAEDSSGKGNHGTPTGQVEAGDTLPTYDAGGAQLIGTHALHAHLGEYIALGSPTDFLFGTESFTVSFWVKAPAGGITGDPSYIGNKNWASGGNVGFTVAADTSVLQWNWKADSSSSPRRDADQIGTIMDGTWHHVVVSHDRNSVASFYIDGLLKATVPLVGDASIDSPLTLNILQDGTGRYGFANDTGARFLDVFLDDFGIWRRALTPQEAASIHTKGRAGQDLTTATFTGVTAPVISAPPANLTVYEGFRARFAVTATGTPPFTYQWKKNGNDIQGATSDTYTIAAAAEADEGNYSVVVSNSGGPTTSASATLTVNPPPTAQVTGQWDFENGDLTATVGAPMQYRGDTAATTTFSTVQIGGSPAKVMGFPKTSPTQGFVLPHGASPNGGGAFVNNYTVIYDLMFPLASNLKWRALWQTSTGNANDGDLFVNNANGIGISGNYTGVIQPDVWHRVAFTINSTDGVLRKFIDGAFVGQQTIATTDGRFSLDTTALVFTDEDGETEAGFVNSIQFRNWIISDSAVAALGGATAAGIPGASSGPKLTATKSGSGITITVDSAGTYQLQFKADLNTGTWGNVGAAGPGPFTGSNPGFYRVQKQ